MGQYHKLFNLDKKHYVHAHRIDNGNKYSGRALWRARWWAQMDCRVHTTFGPTPLVAAMRCFVVGRQGETVQIPKELSK